MTSPSDQRSNASGGGRGGKHRGGRKGSGGGGKRNPGGGGKNPGGRGKNPGGGGRKPGGGGGTKPGGRGRPDDSRADELAKPLKRVLERIPATQREVLEWRMGLKDGHPHDLSSTAEQLGLSIAETREIEQRAFEHIREVVPLDQLQKFLG